jgi:hypothetical protein
LTNAKPYRVPKLGDLLPGKFVVPQNPIVNTLVHGYSGTPQSRPTKTACPAPAAGGSSNLLLIAAAVIGGFWLLSKA